MALGLDSWFNPFPNHFFFLHRSISFDLFLMRLIGQHINHQTSFNFLEMIFWAVNYFFVKKKIPHILALKFKNFPGCFFLNRTLLFIKINIVLPHLVFEHVTWPPSQRHLLHPSGAGKVDISGYFSPLYIQPRKMNVDIPEVDY